MKIGILTFHRCINYGSYWQARSLAEGLQSLGYEIEILDHQSNRVNIAEWRCAFQPVLPTPVPRSDYPLYKQKIKNFFEAFKLLPLSAPFPLEHPSQMDEYDMIMVGSDEVWNLSHPWYGYYPVFYGDGIRAKRLISYAASFGNYDVTWKPDHEWVSKLQKFDKISVRDENSQTLIRNIFGFAPEMVLDPCLQFPVLGENDNPLPWESAYIAVYGHNFSDAFIQNVRSWAKDKKLSLVSIGFRNDWADVQWLTAGPRYFPSFISQAKAVVTNFFHGCVFSIINSKPFVCETSPYRGHKVYDLMNKAGCGRRIMKAETPFALYDVSLSEPLNEDISMNITALRKASNAWLDEALTSNVLSYEDV